MKDDVASLMKHIRQTICQMGNICTNNVNHHLDLLLESRVAYLQDMQLIGRADDRQHLAQQPQLNLQECRREGIGLRVWHKPPSEPDSLMLLLLL